jgi:alkylation response protein AidB-like acyl-CoA dehydrogenase
MSNAPHYKSNLRDVCFNLFEYFEVQKKYQAVAPYAAMSESESRDIIATFETFACSELGSSFVDSDRIPLKIDDQGNITLPPTLTSGIRAFYEGGWSGLDIPERLSGIGASASIYWGAFEAGSGANPCVSLYVSMNSMVARVIDAFGTEHQKKLFVQPMLDRHWGGTMVLTEPDAGSDVGAGRTKAKQIKDDLYEIEGVKRFITNGDYDYPENIVHLVLARPEGAGPGTKGLSLFIVPKFWVNDDGSFGERNGIYATGIEKKMGIKGSATCEMTLGAKAPARGYLVGNAHDGIRQMFMMIEHARMAVGVKSMATLSTAYLNALDYAKIRIQGPHLTKMTDKASPRVRIIEHPDVRRMLMDLKCHSEGMRALCLFTATTRDEAELAKFKGEKVEHEKWEGLNDLLLPLVKGYCSDRSFALIADALQIFGGSGYCQDYPLEQYLRDQKIDTLYEGTTHIQSLDLLFRKILKDEGRGLKVLLEKAQVVCVNKGAEDEMSLARNHLATALGELQKLLGALQTKLKEHIFHAGLQGNRVLHAVAEVVIGWLLIDQASVALQKIPSAQSQDKFFYLGKVASAQHFCAEFLPKIGLLRRLVEASDLRITQLAEESF